MSVETAVATDGSYCGKIDSPEIMSILLTALEVAVKRKVSFAGMSTTDAQP